MVERGVDEARWLLGARCAGRAASPAAAAATTSERRPATAASRSSTVSAASSLKEALHRLRRATSPAPTCGSPSRARTSSPPRSGRASSPTSSPPPTRSCPTQLYDEGLVEKPVVFAGNRLVLAVPAGRAKVASLDDLERPTASSSRSAPSPCRSAPTRARCSTSCRPAQSEGDPRQRALQASPTSRASSASSRRARSTPASSTSPTSQATGGKLKAIELPDRPRSRRSPTASRVVKGAKQPEAAQAFIDGLLDGRGRAGAARRRASSRRRRSERGAAVVRRRCWSRRSRRRCSFLTLPVVAIFVDTRPRELLDEPRRPGRARRAAAEPARARAIAVAIIVAGRHARPPTCSPRAASAAARWSSR